MDPMVIFPILCSVCLLAIYVVGYWRKIRADSFKESVVRKLQKIYCNMEPLGKITYHGGYPPMARPSVLEVGISSKQLILYNFKGWSAQIPLQDCLDIEKFVTRQNPKYAIGSFTLLGPLVTFFYRTKYTYFITVKYMDIKSEENYLVFEADSLKQQECVYQAFQSCFYNRKGYKQVPCVTVTN